MSTRRDRGPVDPPEYQYMGVPPIAKAIVVLVITLFVLTIGGGMYGCPIYQKHASEESLKTEVDRIKAIGAAVKENPEYLRYLQIEKGK